MKLIPLVTGMLAVNTYIIAAEGGDTCAVIDPGEAAPVLDALSENGLACTHILLTHGHFDHIGGVKALREQTGATVCIHSADAEMLGSNRKNLSVLTGALLDPIEPDRLLKDGDTIEAGGLTLAVLHTPGHSPGGVCYVAEGENAIFCGDTVFLEGAGRTDFPGASQKELYRSIADKLFSLPLDDAVLYPGHDEPTTLNHERAHNPLYLLGPGLNW